MIKEIFIESGLYPSKNYALAANPIDEMETDLAEWLSKHETCGYPSSPYVIALHNEYCKASNNGDDEIFDMEFFMCNILDSDSDLENFSTSDEYVWMDGYGYFHSGRSYEALAPNMDANNIASWIVEKYDYPEVREAASGIDIIEEMIEAIEAINSDDDEDED